MATRGSPTPHATTTRTRQSWKLLPLFPIRASTLSLALGLGLRLGLLGLGGLGLRLRLGLGLGLGLGLALGLVGFVQQEPLLRVVFLVHQTGHVTVQLLQTILQNHVEACVLLAFAGCLIANFGLKPTLYIQSVVPVQHLAIV